MFLWVKIWVNSCFSEWKSEWDVKLRQILIHGKSRLLEQTLNFTENAYIFNLCLFREWRCSILCFSTFQVQKYSYSASHLINLTYFSKWLKKSAKSLLYKLKKSSEILRKLRNSEPGGASGKDITNANYIWTRRPGLGDSSANFASSSQLPSPFESLSHQSWLYRVVFY